MQSWTLRELRTRVDGGDGLGQADAAALLDALDVATRAAKIPAEFVVRVARDGDLEGWSAHHPLMRSSRTADHPADALILGAQELREVLGDLGVTPKAKRRGIRLWVVDSHIDRAVAEANRATAEHAVGDSLGWALSEIDRLTGDLDAAEGRRDLLSSAAFGDADARERLRLDAVAAFEQANVHTSAASWSTDALGDAPSVGLDLPTLVVAIDVARSDRVAGWRFTDDREWFALSHRVEPRPMSRYVDRVVSPLQINEAAELALRRLAPRIPTGRSVAAFVNFAALVARELPEVDVARLDSRLSPAWVPLPTSAIPLLCAGTVDEELDLDALVEHDGWGPWADHWELAWVTDHPAESDW